MTKRIVRRWRFWACFQGEGREKKAEEEIQKLIDDDWKAKIWAPLPQHKTSGHTHVVVLCNLGELMKLAGIDRKDHISKVTGIRRECL